MISPGEFGLLILAVLVGCGAVAFVLTAITPESWWPMPPGLREPPMPPPPPLPPHPPTSAAVSGYWIISGPLPLDGKPKWPAPWRAQFMPKSGGAVMGWGLTLEAARVDALVQAASIPPR